MTPCDACTAALADAAGRALVAALERLAPAERLALVLRDVLGLPFAEIAPLVQRRPAAARRLVRSARRRLRAGR